MIGDSRQDDVEVDDTGVSGDTKEEAVEPDGEDKDIQDEFIIIDEEARNVKNYMLVDCISCAMLHTGLWLSLRAGTGCGQSEAKKTEGVWS